MDNGGEMDRLSSRGTCATYAVSTALEGPARKAEEHV